MYIMENHLWDAITNGESSIHGEPNGDTMGYNGIIV